MTFSTHILTSLFSRFSNTTVRFLATRYVLSYLFITSCLSNSIKLFRRFFQRTLLRYPFVSVLASCSRTNSTNYCYRLFIKLHLPLLTNIYAKVFPHSRQIRLRLLGFVAPIKYTISNLPYIRAAHLISPLAWDMAQ